MPAELGMIKDLFVAALRLPVRERFAYLETACRGDTALRQQIEEMLQAHENSGELLLRSPAEMLEDSGTTEADATAAFLPRGPATQIDDPRDGADDLSFLAPSTQPGKIGRLEHYEIIEVVGKGGFGTVLKAFDEKLHRVVAIKVLSVELSASGTARQRFIREARTAAAVSHEHVVTIHAVVEEHRPPYLVMQMIDGITLQEKLDRVGMLNLREILRIGMQMAEGLAAAHKQGLVHRDIKPANILLENGVERVKITDFGLARAVDDASVTQSGTVAGTPMYMSPEQAEGLTIDHRSDLFSLGTVLYAMCTGHPPFRASGTHAVLKRVIDASPRPIREINNEIPEWLCDIIAKLHAKKPEDRFQTAKEVADLLGQHLAHVQQPATYPAPPLIEKVPASATTSTDRAFAPSEGTLTHDLNASPRRSRRWQHAAMLVFVIGLAAGALQYFKTRNDGAPADPNFAKVALQWENVGNLDFQWEGEGFGMSRDSSHLGKFMKHLPPGECKLEVRFQNEVIFETRLTLEAGKTKFVVIPTKGDLVIDNNGTHGPVVFRTKHSMAGLISGSREVEREVATEDVAVASGLVVGFYDWGFSTREGKKLASGSVFVRPGKKNVVRAVGGTSDAPAPTKKLPLEASSTGEIARFGNKDGMIRLALSPHATHVLTAHSSNVARYWELASGKEIHRLDHPEGQVYAVAVSPDGKWLASAGENSRIYLWDAGSGKQTIQLEGHVSNITGLCFSPDSKRLVSAGWDKTLRLWDVAKGEAILSIPAHPAGIQGACFSPDGKFVASWSFDKTAILWDARTLKEVRRLDGHMAMIRTAAFSADSERLLTGDHPKPAREPGCLKLWDVRTEKPLLSIDGIAGGVHGLAISGDGRRALTGSGAGAGLVQLWDLTTGKQIIAFKGHDPAHGVSDVAFLPGNRAVSAGGDGSLCVWQLPPEEPGWVQLFNGKDLLSWDAANSKNWMIKDTILAGTDKSSIASNGKYGDFHLRATVRASLKGIASITFRGNPATHGVLGLAGPRQGAALGLFAQAKTTESSASNKGVMPANTWYDLDLIVRGNRATVRINGAPVTEAVIDGLPTTGQVGLRTHVDGTTLEFKKIEIKELPPDAKDEITLVRKLPGPQVAIGRVAYSKDGKFVLAAAGSQVHRWNVDSGLLDKSFQLGDGLIQGMATLRDPQRLVTTDNKGRVRLWDLSTETVLRDFESHKRFTGALAVSPDETLVLSGGDDSVVRLSELATGKELQVSKAWCRDTAFDRNGALVAFGSSFHASVFEIDGWKRIKYLQTTKSFSVRTVAFSPDGRFLLTGTDGRSLQLWDLATEKKVHETVLQGPIRSCAFLPDGRHYVAGCEDKSLRIWNTDSGALVYKVDDANHATNWLAVSPDGRTVATGGGSYLVNPDFFTYGDDGDYALRLWRLPESVWPAQHESEPGWVPLFNGKDTTGWKYHGKHLGDWAVKDGALTSVGKGNYLYTERGDYADFHLRAEVQLESGYGMIDFRTPFGATSKDVSSQPLLDGYQVVIGQAGANPTGSLRRTRASFSLAEKGLVDPKDWFQLEIIAKGDRMESLINGKPAASYIDPKRLYAKGHIALQTQRPDTVVRFRKIEIKELSDRRGTLDIVNRHATETAAVNVSSIDSKKGVFKLEDGVFLDPGKRWSLKLDAGEYEIKVQSGGKGPPDVVERVKIEDGRTETFEFWAPANNSWTVVDSHKDSKVDHQDQRVTFTLPGKFRYMIATEFNRTTDAPRLMQSVEGDFDLHAKLMPLPKLPGNPSSGGGSGSISAGLLLWHDDENFVTLFQNKAGNSDKGIVTVQGAMDGKKYTLFPKFKSHPLADAMKPVCFRAERRGDQVRGFVSEDGVKWSLVAEVTTKFPAKISAGMCASINQTTGAQVELSELKLTPRPPAPPPAGAVAPSDAVEAKEHQEAWAKHLGVDAELTNSIGMTVGRFRQVVKETNYKTWAELKGGGVLYDTGRLLAAPSDKEPGK